MEALIKEMQDPETGVRVRSQKVFLSIIPSAFMGAFLLDSSNIILFRYLSRLSLLTYTSRVSYVPKRR